MRDETVYEMENGYTLTLDWDVYPAATVTRNGQTIGRHHWVMTGWLFPHFRVRRWALKTVRRHERMVRLLARNHGSVAVDSSWEKS